jgi:hypothetical protein
MTGWVIIVDQPRDLPNAETPHKVITTTEYLARPRLFEMARPKLVNLARSYAYQSKGYYASLLAEARGHRVVPTVETMLELREQKLYEYALPDLEDELNRCARRADFQPDNEMRLLVCFGIARDQRFESFGRLLFDMFRCPALEVTAEPGDWLSIDRIRPRNITRLAKSGAIPRRGRSPNTISRCSTIRMRRPHRRRPPRSSILPVSPTRCRSTSSQSPSASSRSLPNSTACSSARPPRSTITPIASRAVPGRKVCR